MSKLLTISIISITDISKDLLPLILDYYYDRKEVEDFYNKVVDEYRDTVCQSNDFLNFYNKRKSNCFEVTSRKLKIIGVSPMDDPRFFQRYIWNFLTGKQTKYDLSPNYYHQKLYKNS